MSAALPHYLLLSESRETGEPDRWRFVLRSADGCDRLVADDVEPGTQGERLELLTVVRGLEALDQPSRVTLMTPSAYVREGIRYGLSEWRRNGWHWESFGQMVPVKDRDLWQRVDRTLEFHHVECRNRRFDPPHKSVPGPTSRGFASEHRRPASEVRSEASARRFQEGALGCRGGIARRLWAFSRRAARTWRALASCVWLR